MTRGAPGPGAWTVVGLLLGAARRRAYARAQRQMKLRLRRGAKYARLWFSLGVAFAVAMGAMLHLAAVLGLFMTESTAERVQAEAKGRVVVEEWFAGRVATYEAEVAKIPARRAEITRAEDADIAIEAPILAGRDEGDEKTIEAQLRATVRTHPKALISERSLWWQPGAVPDIAALFILLWWALMLVCQGEGVTLDVQRQRNPMWEWLFSHPASPAAIFLAEMIAPIAANPVYLTAPLLPGILFGHVYGWPLGIVAAVLVGAPIALALACLSKAVEICVVLRLPPKARGAVLGLMGWFGFVAMLPLFVVFPMPRQPIVVAVCNWLAPLGDLPWPRTRLLIGLTAAGHYVFWEGVVLCWVVAAVLILGAVALALLSARYGLVGRPGAGGRRAAVVAPAWFVRAPLYRKELLWFRRDGRALVQVVLVPLSLAAFQIFNLRGLLPTASGGWTTICGMAILFGTYFLLTLGPQSLTSEGQALWIAQTWPRGLESLLKTKAKLWALITTAIVETILIYAAWRYPADIGGIVVVGVLWGVFARSLAEKTVTLATVTSSSGEQEKPPGGSSAAAMLGTLTFAVGVLTRQWSLAIAGVVYSTLTAAAMWQSFRYRLPYLADPWSEILPPAPSLMHAMVAISAMVEGVSLLSAVALGLFGRDAIASINVGLYGFCAIVAMFFLSRILARRGVAQRDIWLWRDEDGGPRPFLGLGPGGRARVALVVAAGAILGAALGLTAHVYVAALHQWPDLAQILDEGQRRLQDLPNARLASAVLAIGFAPFAEEFLFRGLLYRALDREWGGWRAIVGAGMFFAIYHPALSWAPVAALGAMNAVIFKRTGRLAPAVAAHMAYNAVVLAF